MLISVNGLGGLGGDLWSESAFMINYLNGTLNSTDLLVGSQVADSFWESVREPNAPQCFDGVFHSNLPCPDS